ncbi:glucomannan 4-beta-mannosyltransferase 1-like [Canna indica]|uniref:glucomannan 4-beta-mannosyltransferase n=1 Tax=Canna indica TaxID=4628 RepID=A0AAQ3JN27_9LILI|nr:glucomannan 4-beta-mannosyltransferase 1-like [Canna indica]
MEPFPAAAPFAAASSSATGINLNAVSSVLIFSDGITVPGALESLAWREAGAFLGRAADAWRVVRSQVVAPVLWVAVAVCLVMSVMLLVEVVAMAAASLAVKLPRRRPEVCYRWEPIAAVADDPEAGSLAFPMVLVQIPMYNEREVYKLSIGAACALSWPSDRIIIQVLDDSTDPTVKDMVEIECRLWANKGININYEVRENRKGYKAGALKQGLEHSYAKQCEFVAIFDADFQPEPDFLFRIVPFLVYNPEIALVQARWQFVNFRDCLMTRIQKMTLDYHFKVEQEAGSSTFAFFGFNGTAGVWRTSAINGVGGWKDRTTVEDMDLAVRATIRGWKLLYVGDIEVKSELPSTFKAYRHQQHRWTCGAAHLFRRMVVEISKAKEVSILKRFYLIYSFFFVRKIVAHLVTFFLYCIVIPVSVLVPEVTIPAWGVTYIPTTITLLNATRNPRFNTIQFFFFISKFLVNIHACHSCFAFFINQLLFIIYIFICVSYTIAALSILCHSGFCSRMSCLCTG